MCSSMNCRTRFCNSFTLAEGSKFIALSSFLQERDLARMIEVVLNHAVQQEVNGVGFPSNVLIQPVRIEHCDRATQSLVSAFQVAQRDLPGGFSGIAYGRPI